MLSTFLYWYSQWLSATQESGLLKRYLKQNNMGYSGIMFDGEKMVDYTIDNPGPYKVWAGRKYVALITKSQYDLMNDKNFWQQRLSEQKNYIAWLSTQNYNWSGRMQQLLTSAIDVLHMIENKVKHEEPR